ncbi:MAG TPA: hypothetical protein VFE72_10505 [Lysobacter sp.]|nr:hypothetical protein [Lysobacter sp.]
MLTKADFQTVIRDSISSFPAIAALYQAGDPRILQHMDAMATMLAMFSAQAEVAQAEPFEKTRDSTVLADAAMRGIIRKGTPARVRLRADNKGTMPYSLASGRNLLDSSGRTYRVETAVVVPPGGSAMLDATQVRYTSMSHTVAGSEPFYAVEVPAAEDDTFLCSIAVSDAGGEYAHRDRYVNTAPDERVFHVEADDRQRIYVRFGYQGVVGVQPADGTTLTLTIGTTAGRIQLPAGTPFSFEYLNSPAESSIELKMEAMLVAGQNPIPMSVLRDLARYPSVYDSNAVYLGEFDFLVRRNFSTLRFLSVWNEAAEEAARGPHISNTNAIFVACLSQSSQEAVLTAEAPDDIPAPERVPVAEWTATQRAIRELIRAADDSYRVHFVTPVRVPIEVTIHATVPTSYIASDVRQKIIEAILAEYGEQSAAARRGRNQPLYQNVYALLRQRVQALNVGSADLQVSIAAQPEVLNRPELWRFVSPDSLTVEVQTANITAPSWNG